MDNSDLALLIVAGLVLLAGCAEMTTTTKVAADGEIERMTVEAEIQESVYESLENEVESRGYESVAAFIEDEVADGIGETSVDSVTASTEPVDGDRYLLSVTATQVNPNALGDVTVTVENGTMYYESTDVLNRNFTGHTYEFDDTGGINDDLFGGIDDGDGGYGEDLDDLFEEHEEEIWIEYSVTMPGEIVAHNADEVSDDERTASWGFMGDEVETVYAESEIGGGSGDDSNSGDDGNGGADDPDSGDDADDDSAGLDDGGVFDPSDDDERETGDDADNETNDTRTGDPDDDGSASESVPGFGFSTTAVAFIALLVGAGFALRLR